MNAFYNARRRNLITATPNPAHFSLAPLETALAERSGDLTLITQNIDDLHERAGSTRVIHMHGELLKARCTDCEGVNPWRKDLGLQDQCPVCGRMGGLRPHVVWFGEMPLQMKAIYAALKGADLFVAIGTSGAVYPAARFAAQTRTFGIGTLEINLEPSDNANQFGERRYGRASEMVPVWVSEVLPSLDVAIIIPTGRL